jgi:hypothetical protein
MKHLKHTIATCAFSVASAYCSDKWRLVYREFDVGTELEVAKVTVVELVGDTDLGRGRVRRMEHRHDGSASPGAS